MITWKDTYDYMGRHSGRTIVSKPSEAGAPPLLASSAPSRPVR